MGNKPAKHEQHTTYKKYAQPLKTNWKGKIEIPFDIGDHLAGNPSWNTAKLVHQIVLLLIVALSLVETVKPNLGLPPKPNHTIPHFLAFYITT